MKRKTFIGVHDLCFKKKLAFLIKEYVLWNLYLDIKMSNII